MRRTGWLLTALVLVALLAIATVALRPNNLTQNHSASGYWIAAQYFHARQGAARSGVELLVTAPTQAEAGALRQRLAADGGTAVVQVQSGAELGLLARGLHAAPAGTAALPDWPDPALAGVTSLRLGKQAFAIAGAEGPPLLVTAARHVVMTRLTVGRGTLWLISDPRFFSNAEIGWRGHLQILANLVREHGGRLEFAQWPVPPPHLAAPGRLLALGLALLPGLLLLLWALGARFGAVRRERSPDRLAPGDRDALAWLLRRRQAGRLALQVLLEEYRAVLPDGMRREIEFRIARGRIGSQELERWRRRIAEMGGTRVG